MFWFGEVKENSFDLKTPDIWRVVEDKRKSFIKTPLENILDILDRFSQESFDDCLPQLIKESGFSEEETRKTLAILPSLLKRESLERRLRAEFIRPEVLDDFVKLPHGAFKAHAVPMGALLHVTAGNVFLSSIDSLVMGLLTKNVSILKVSTRNQYFPNYIAKKLLNFDKDKIVSDKFAVIYWKGGDEEIEPYIINKVNGIIAWGGEEMISSYRKHLPLHVKLLDFGPKISIQVISRKGLLNRSLSQIADKIVSDITPWNQGACASPQNLYLQEGIDENAFFLELERAFERSPKRGEISEDEATEILKETYRAHYSELMEEGKFLQGQEYLVHLENNRLLRPSPLNRSLIIKRFKDAQELTSLLNPFSYYLQSCSYLFDDSEKKDFLLELSSTGLKRFAPLGTITWGMEGAPHDGRFVLRELVTFIGDEFRVQDYGEVVTKTTDSSLLKDHFNHTSHPKGYIFSSGGTTGEPKFLHFSYEEFDYMSDMLAENFKRQGLKAGMLVANLFVAGNLWSSFLCVEKALEKMGAIQLPIGGMCSQENISFYLKKFKPQVVMGIPSMLVMNAEFMAKSEPKVEIPMVFYAGEALSEARRDYLKQIWGTLYFGSAGYASVDAGVIGYQCLKCKDGEHHLFSDLIKLDILDNEGIVSSMARSSMPIKNYHTGDRMMWIDDCDCGSKDKRFKLLGRVDNLIQIWSCRLNLSDIEKGLSKSGVLTFQIKISETREHNLLREKLTILIEEGTHPIDEETLLFDIYEISRDLRDTISFPEFKQDSTLKIVPEGMIPRNSRTGKISLIIDSRK